MTRPPRSFARRSLPGDPAHLVVDGGVEVRVVDGGVEVCVERGGRHLLPDDLSPAPPDGDEDKRAGRGNLRSK